MLAAEARTAVIKPGDRRPCTEGRRAYSKNEFGMQKGCSLAPARKLINRSISAGPRFITRFGKNKIQLLVSYDRGKAGTARTAA